MHRFALIAAKRLMLMYQLRSQTHRCCLKRDRKGFAVASVFLAASFLVFLALTYIAYPLSDDIGSVFIVLAFFSPLLSIPGFIFGIKGLKSSRKGLAIVGLVLNILLFLVLLLFTIFMYLISLNWR